MYKRQVKYRAISLFWGNFPDFKVRIRRAAGAEGYAPAAGQGRNGASVVMVVVAGVGGLLLLALGAQCPDLGFVGSQGVAGLGDAFGQLAAHGGVGDFGHRAAAGTDHQQVMRCAAGIVAGAPGVDGIQPCLLYTSPSPRD